MKSRLIISVIRCTASNGVESDRNGAAISSTTVRRGTSGDGSRQSASWIRSSWRGGRGGELKRIGHVRVDLALGAHLQERVRPHVGQQVGDVAEAIFVAPHVARRFESQREALDALVGVVARTEMRVHDRFADLVAELQAGDVRDGDPHCCCCAAMI